MARRFLACMVTGSLLLCSGARVMAVENSDSGEARPHGGPVRELPGPNIALGKKYTFDRTTLTSAFEPDLPVLEG